MARPGRAASFVAVFAGEYAILMLINDQLTDFNVSAGICAVSLLGAALLGSANRFATLTSGTRHAMRRKGLSLEGLPVGRRPLAAQQVHLGQHVYVAQPDSSMAKLAAGRPS
jgi:hypothetical protein